MVAGAGRSQVRQTRFQKQQLLHARFHRFEMAVNHLMRAVGPGGTRFGNAFEQHPNFFETDVERAAAANEFQTRDMFVPVGTVVVRKPLRRREQSRFFIKADRLRRVPRAGGKFSDSHRSSAEKSEFDLTVRHYGRCA